MNISDCLLETFAMESTWLRSRKMGAAGKAAVAADICSVFLRDAIARIESAARTVIGACCEAKPPIATLTRCASWQLSK